MRLDLGVRVAGPGSQEVGREISLECFEGGLPAKHFMELFLAHEKRLMASDAE